MRAALVALCLLAAASVAVTRAEARETVLLPTVECPVRAGISGQRYPRWPARAAASVPASLRRKLALYVGGYERLVAPRGWGCKEQEGADGSNVITVSHGRSTVEAWAIPACVGCIYSATCRYFPKEASPLSVGIPCPAGKRGDRVTRLSRTLARVEERSGRSRLVFLETRGQDRAAGIDCLATRGFCAAILADWRAQRR